ncbi:MAG: phosphatidylinositol kinase, partial [Flavobacteriales bacterium]|nr:phosphatidylinositol kinase [Flavobacteriales bacterium]
GEMKNGKMQGKGIYTFSNGEIYEGEFKDNMFHGKGKYTWTDGKVESGTWENDDRIDKKK